MECPAAMANGGAHFLLTPSRSESHDDGRENKFNASIKQAHEQGRRIDVLARRSGACKPQGLPKRV